MTKKDEEIYIRERTRIANNDFDVIGVDPAQRAWLNDSIGQIAAWKDDMEALNFINISTTNAYQRRLIHQEVRRLWYGKLQTLPQGMMVRVMKITEQELQAQISQRHAEIQKDVQKARGFCEVIDMLAASRKPIVGHNIVIDLAYILAQFVGPLPMTMEGYKRMIHHTFPIVMDTKFVSTVPPVQSHAYDSSLGGLEAMVNSVEFMDCPKIVTSHRHQRYYTGGDRSHEAGYDAYITGSIMIKMLAYIEMKKPPTPALEPLRNVNPINPAEKKQLVSKNGRENKTPIELSSPQSRTRAQASSYRTQAPPVREQAPPARVPAPVPQTAPAKKFSYADVVHRGNGPTQQQQQQPQQRQHPHEEPATAHDGYDDNDSDEGYTPPSEPEVFVPLFSFQSPSLQCYQNILYWGRSNHGCVNLSNL
ncbi:ribonuclease H-like domain-containing protein [Mortierella sp. GBAus27b]|nr:ribonuclease H-like domain-containing protein [Mortierella sp. GBAus27b]